MKAPDQSAKFDTGVGKEHLGKGFLVINEVANEDSRPDLAVTPLVVDAANRLGSFGVVGMSLERCYQAHASALDLPHDPFVILESLSPTDS